MVKFSSERRPDPHRAASCVATEHAPLRSVALIAHPELVQGLRASSSTSPNLRGWPCFGSVSRALFSDWSA